MATGTIERWVEMYVRAWTTNDSSDIGALFSDDAAYFPTPFSKGWHGREAIIAGWLDRKDDPDDWSFEYEILCGSDELGVVRGLARYPGERREYRTMWLVRFAPGGRCREFTEWG
jgi:ketosteroid isomerase-like protein